MEPVNSLPAWEQSQQTLGGSTRKKPATATCGPWSATPPGRNSARSDVWRSIAMDTWLPAHPQGMTYKRHGRIGDSPIIGAGTWADDRTCAISATGWGEYFIRRRGPRHPRPYTSRRDGPSGSGGPNDPRRNGRTGRGWRHRGHVQPRRACLFHEHARHVQGRTPSWRNTRQSASSRRTPSILESLHRRTLQTVPALSVTRTTTNPTWASAMRP